MEELYDVVIVGGGPAGLTAAIYLGRAKYRVLVVEKDHFGGQITITSEVVNYPGIEKTSGSALTEAMRKQAESFGAEFLLANVEKLQLDGNIKTVHTDKGEKQCFGVLLATGAHPRMIGFEGEEEFRGRGVAYCATCDGEFFTDKEVFVVGGGFAAAEESVFLTKYASHVTVLVRKEDFSCAKTTADAVKNNKKITVLTNTEVVRVAGDTVLTSMVYKNNLTGEETEYRAKEGDTFGVFVFAGYEPATDLVAGVAELNNQGYVITDSQLRTNVPGLYAAGDVCVKELRQVATAVGDGALAATGLEHYASEQQKKTNRIPQRRELAEHKKENKSRGLFGAEILQQLETVFSKMEQPLVLKLYLNDAEVSKELEGYMMELCKLTNKLSMVIAEDEEKIVAYEERPCVRICHEDHSYSGLAFHGVPGGHEFTSFILGLYNVSGSGQMVDAETRKQIEGIKQPVQIQILVSLSCTMCPDLVTAAQRIASLSPLVTTEVYDLNHFPKLKDKYKVMSVPCMVINQEKIHFGKKNISQILDCINN